VSSTAFAFEEVVAAAGAGALFAGATAGAVSGAGGVSLLVQPQKTAKMMKVEVKIRLLSMKDSFCTRTVNEITGM
jgi:hypothetical protein